MEGVSDEVLIFGAATVATAVMLYYAVGHMFTLVSQPGGLDHTQVSATDGRTRSSNHDCAICLGEATLALETNCGHIYCGNCILEVATLEINLMFGRKNGQWVCFRCGAEATPCRQHLAHIAVRGSLSSCLISRR